ncbi:ASCH domain-containing protein [Chryseobacterium indologenes]|uniref:ASCH domain-containing protein n=1 Tax=Chryseobacterium indologenes TaxID=253 RepID=UPI001BCE665A|nr:ASCH domain-containing protein [Chryseobacterium indologenes]
MKNTKELYLVLTKKNFVDILKGEKKEEYRAFSDYYIDRLGEVDKEGELIGTVAPETIRFQMGYSKNAPQMVVECKDVLIEVDKDVEEGEDLTTENSNFALILGNILENTNCEKLIV